MRHQFRLWDKDECCYYEEGRRGKDSGWYWFNVASNGDIITGCDDVVDEPAHVDNWVLEQYVGLRDSKRTPEYPEGQMVFEGDVVEGVWQVDHAKKVIGVVKYYEEYGLWAIEDQHGIISVIWGTCINLGSIHQNPELIGDK